MEYIDLVQPIPFPSTNQLMLGRTGSKKGIITRVMVGYTGNIFPKKPSRDVGKACTSDSPSWGKLHFFLLTISILRLAQGVTVQGS